MQDFLAENSILVVLIIAFIIFTGVGFYLIALERKVKKLEEKANAVAEEFDE